MFLHEQSFYTNVPRSEIETSEILKTRKQPNGALISLQDTSREPSLCVLLFGTWPTRFTNLDFRTITSAERTTVRASFAFPTRKNANPEFRARESGCYSRTELTFRLSSTFRRDWSYLQFMSQTKLEHYHLRKSASRSMPRLAKSLYE